MTTTAEHLAPPTILEASCQRASLRTTALVNDHGQLASAARHLCAMLRCHYDPATRDYQQGLARVEELLGVQPMTRERFEHNVRQWHAAHPDAGAALQLSGTLLDRAAARCQLADLACSLAQMPNAMEAIGLEHVAQGFRDQADAVRRLHEAIQEHDRGEWDGAEPFETSPEASAELAKLDAQAERDQTTRDQRQAELFARLGMEQ